MLGHLRDVHARPEFRPPRGSPSTFGNFLGFWPDAHPFPTWAYAPNGIQSTGHLLVLRHRTAQPQTGGRAEPPSTTFQHGYGTMPRDGKAYGPNQRARRALVSTPPEAMTLRAVSREKPPPKPSTF